jgi:hypothetical protein
LLIKEAMPPPSDNANALWAYVIIAGSVEEEATVDRWVCTHEVGDLAGTRRLMRGVWHELISTTPCRFLQSQHHGLGISSDVYMISAFARMHVLPLRSI